MGKRQISPLQAGRVRLRLLAEQDLPRTLAWRNQDHIRRWFFYSERLTLEQHAQWFARYQPRDDDFVFMIEEIPVLGANREGSLVPVVPPLGGIPPKGGTTSAHAAPLVPMTEKAIIEEAIGEPRPIGQVAIYNVDWSSGTAEFGRLMIGEADAAGRGLAREATAAVVVLALEQLGLQEVYLEVIPSNVRAIKVYEACGFEVTGSTEKAVRMSRRAVAKAA